MGFLGRNNQAYSKIHGEGFTGHSAVKNLPANAGDMGRSLIWEDPTCQGAAKPMRRLLNPGATTTEARASRAPAPRQERPRP